MSAPFDLVIQGATVVNHDGEGVRDIGIRDGRIVAMGSLGSAKTMDTLDAGAFTSCQA